MPAKRGLVLQIAVVAFLALVAGGMVVWDFTDPLPRPCDTSGSVAVLLAGAEVCP